MTVKELIDKLINLPPETAVYVRDYCEGSDIDDYLDCEVDLKRVNPRTTRTTDDESIPLSVVIS